MTLGYISDSDISNRVNIGWKKYLTTVSEELLFIAIWRLVFFYGQHISIVNSNF